MAKFWFLHSLSDRQTVQSYFVDFFRHSVACFLTRGDLWVSWEEGQAVFEELLLDADWSLNAGNWMWLSASAFFHQYYRVYSPVAFGKKTDPLGKWRTYFFYKSLVRFLWTCFSEWYFSHILIFLKLHLAVKKQIYFRDFTMARIPFPNLFFANFMQIESKKKNICCRNRQS